MEVDPRALFVKAPKTGAHFCVVVLWGKEYDQKITYHYITFANAKVGMVVEGWTVIVVEIQLVDIEGE